MTETANAIVVSQTSAIDELIDQTLQTVKSTSARVYQQTYGLWKDWCLEHNVNPLDFRPTTVNQFLESRHVTRNTRKRQLSAMRKLAKMLWILSGTDETSRIYTALSMMTPTDKNLNDEKRELFALSPEEVAKILAVWQGDSLLHIRNRALVLFLAKTGVRRSEAAILQWDDIDLNKGIAYIYGKGDKSRMISIFGDDAIEALRQWKQALPNRKYVFPSFNQKQHPGEDKPTDGQTVYRVVKHTESKSGVSLSPHTLRRTLITNALANNVPHAEMQAQAGHANEATTLRYAYASNAEARRNKYNIGY